MLPVVDFRIAAAFSAGTVTFLAPCAFPLLPGYVAYFLSNGDGQEGTLPVRRRLLRGVGVSLVVSAGFFLVYAVVVGVALAAGSGVVRNIALLEPLVGAILVGLGIGMLFDRFRPTNLHVQLPERRRSVTGYFLFGVVYAVAAAGCSGPIFFGLAAWAVESGPTTALAVFGSYALGMSLVMLGVTTASALGRETLLRRLSRESARLTRVAGAVLIVAGIAQVYYFLFQFGGLRMLGVA